MPIASSSERGNNFDIGVGFRQVLRRRANDLLVDGAARLKIGLGKIKFGLTERTAGFSLRDVGLGHFANREPVLGGLQFGAEKVEVVLAEAARSPDRARRRRKPSRHRAALAVRHCAIVRGPARTAGFSGVHGVGRLKAAKNRLHHLHRIAARRRCPAAAETGAHVGSFGGRHRRSRGYPAGSPSWRGLRLHRSRAKWRAAHQAVGCSDRLAQAYPSAFRRWLSTAVSASTLTDRRAASNSWPAAPKAQKPAAQMTAAAALRDT